MGVNLNNVLSLALRDHLLLHSAPTTVDQPSILEQSHVSACDRAFGAKELFFGLSVTLVETLERIFSLLEFAARYRTITTSLTFAKLR